MSLPTGERLGPYEIYGLIGKGGMGEVYRARDARLDRTVAIKVLPAEFSAQEERLRRFEQEAQVLGALNHPNLLAIYDVGAQNGTHFLVSELLEGESLASGSKQGALPVRKAMDLGVQIAKGLAAAHEKGIVHRDIKPDNIFLTRDGRAKILDFGLAKQSGAERSGESATITAVTDPGTVLGTAGYMSPEQVRGKLADARSDIFSFGAILYEMVAGAARLPGRFVRGNHERDSQGRTAAHSPATSPRRLSASSGGAWRKLPRSAFNRRAIWRLRWRLWLRPRRLARGNRPSLLPRMLPRSVAGLPP